MTDVGRSDNYSMPPFGFGLASNESVDYLRIFWMSLCYWLILTSVSRLFCSLRS